MLSTKVVLEDNTLITTDLAGQIFIAARQRWQRGHWGKEKSDKDEGGGIKETQRRDIEETHRRDMSGNDEGEDTEERQER